jgi:GNAT superfamily N-acetyltransferase
LTSVDCRSAGDSEEQGSASEPGLPPGYPEELECDVVSDGMAPYHVRPIRPDDASRLRTFHSRLQGHSIYLRFFNCHPELSAEEVEHFTCVDYVNRLALVAEMDDRLIAVGRYERDPGQTEAEVAFVVSDELQHHGVGSLLLDELVKAARTRGIESFRAETLCENHAMLDVFRHVGFPVTSRVEYGTVILHFPIADCVAYRLALAERELRRRSKRDVLADGNVRESP